MNIGFDNATKITFFLVSCQNFFNSTVLFFPHYFPNHYSRVAEGVKAACYSKERGNPIKFRIRMLFEREKNKLNFYKSITWHVLVIVKYKLCKI